MLTFAISCNAMLYLSNSHGASQAHFIKVLDVRWFQLYMKLSILSKIYPQNIYLTTLIKAKKHILAGTITAPFTGQRNFSRPLATWRVAACSFNCSL